jgi:DNA-binding transcriptional LysR family regulator
VATIGLSDGIIPKGLNRTLILQERYGLYCGSHHALFGRANLTFDDLRGEAFVGFPADVLGGSHMGPVTALRAAATFGQFVRATSCNVEEICRMIRIGIGIGVLPLHLARPLVEAKELWRLPPYRKLPEADVYLIANPRAELNPAEIAFAAAMRDLPAVRT